MRILIVLLPDQHEAKSLRISRLAEPYYLFKDDGHQIVLASPSGGSPMSSSLALNSGSAQVRRFNADQAGREKLAYTIALDQVVINDFDAAYCLGMTGRFGSKLAWMPR